MTTWRQPESGVTTRLVDGTTFVHVTGLLAVAVLNSTALTVWQQAEHARDLADLIERVCLAHAVGTEFAREDVSRTVTDLVSAGLLIETA